MILSICRIGYCRHDQLEKCQLCISGIQSSDFRLNEPISHDNMLKRLPDRHSYRGLGLMVEPEYSGLAAKSGHDAFTEKHRTM